MLGPPVPLLTHLLMSGAGLAALLSSTSESSPKSLALLPRPPLEAEPGRPEEEKAAAADW